MDDFKTAAIAMIWRRAQEHREQADVLAEQAAEVREMAALLSGLAVSVEAGEYFAPGEVMQYAVGDPNGELARLRVTMSRLLPDETQEEIEARLIREAVDAAA